VVSRIEFQIPTNKLIPFTATQLVKKLPASCNLKVHHRVCYNVPYSVQFESSRFFLHPMSPRSVLISLCNFPHSFVTSLFGPYNFLSTLICYACEIENMVGFSADRFFFTICCMTGFELLLLHFITDGRYQQARPTRVDCGTRGGDVSGSM
jgi:hypothetical protein